MRLVIALLGFFLVIGGSITTVPTMASTNNGGFVLSASQQPTPSGKVDVNIDVNHSRGGGLWYTNPVWLGIGIVALLLILVLFAMAVRGGGTTVIKE